MRKKVFLLFALVIFFGSGISAQVVIQRCDINTGWGGSQTISVDNSDKKEGKGSLTIQAQAGLTDWFKKSFSSTQTGIDETGYLIFWLYVSDASALDGGIIEITSSGGPDNLESAWQFDKSNVVTGWNEMKLQINAANTTGGGVNLDSVNFFRVYQNCSSPITAKIDHIRFASSTEAPAWPELEVQQVDNSTLDGKVMFGYQGWFNHPDDGAGRGWVHWGDLYEPIRLSCDLFPDLREFGADEKYPTHFTYPDGSMVPVFSSYNQNTTIRHMKWIRDYNLDGVFIQRFISGYYNSADMAHKDTVALNVMRGCEKYGGVFAMMYDGIANNVNEMKADWIHMVDDLKLTESDRYLHHRGLPIISLWGYTVRDEATADQLAEMVEFFTNNPNPKYRASVKLGVRADWYNQSAFMESFKQVDVISPWFSGTTNHNTGQSWCDQNNVDYMPVVHPGFSWHNLSLDYESHPGSDDLNHSPRDKGNFLWNEVNEVVSANAKSVYIAMFDEIDEGTAMFKCAETQNDVPVERDWVTLDIDGYDLPGDWYLRLASLTSNVVRGYEDNKSSLDAQPDPPEGIMTIRITDEINDNNQGAMEFIFPDFPDQTNIEISIDSGATFTYSTADDVGSYIITGLNEGNYPIYVRHSAAGNMVDMGHVRISNIIEAAPEAASNPFPENGATDVNMNTVLGWTAGANTVSNIIYFGTSDTPDSITYRATAAFNPGTLEPSTTYYWKINERNALGIAEGELWSFTTGDGSAPKDYVVFDYCDEVEGWSSSNGLELDSQNKQEGFSSISCTGAGTDKFSKKLLEPLNTFADTGSFFSLWIYISDVSAFSGGGQIEIASSGRNDVDEYSWSVPDMGLVDGWNEIHLKIGDAAVLGNPDLSAINFFRFYQFVSKEITTKIDFLRFTNLASIPLDAPLNFTATSANNTVFLDWDDNTEEDFAGYNVYRSTTSGSGFIKINDELITVSEYTDSDVSNGTTYYYYGVCVDIEGMEGFQSTEVSAVPKNNDRPAAPANLTAVAGNEEITLDWDDNTEPDILGYNIYRSTTSGESYWNVTKVTGASVYTDKYLNNGTTYYYVVKAINDSQNESDPSNEVSATPDENVRVEKNPGSSSLRIYPNPASTNCRLMITLEKTSKVSISIFDMTGRELHYFINNQQWMAGEHTVNLPLFGFEKGNYIIKIITNNRTTSKKLMIE